jgi:hypothetical protein
VRWLETSTARRLEGEAHEVLEALSLPAHRREAARRRVEAVSEDAKWCYFSSMRRQRMHMGAAKSRQSGGDKQLGGAVGAEIDGDKVTSARSASRLARTC